MKPLQAFTPLFAVPAVREAFGRDILGQALLEEGFDVVVAVDDGWSAALATMLATRAEKPLIMAAVTKTSPTRAVAEAVHQLSIDKKRTIQITSDFSWNAVQVLVCEAVISDAAVLTALDAVLTSAGARTKAVACIRMERNAQTLALLERFAVFGQSVPSKPLAPPKKMKSPRPKAQRFVERPSSQATANANDPCEDRIAALNDQDLGVELFAVIDGHGGASAAEFLERNLLARIVERLRSSKATRRPEVSEEDVRRAVHEGFASCDEELLDNARFHVQALLSEPIPTPPAEQSAPLAVVSPPEQSTSEPMALTPTRPKRTRKIAPALPPTHPRVLLHQSARAGACAVVAVVVHKRNGTTSLVTAHVGDCRAVVVGGLKRREQSSLFHKSLLEDISSQDSTKSTEVDSSDDEFAIKRTGVSSKRHKRENDADVTDSVISSSEVPVAEQDPGHVVVMTRDHTFEYESEATAVRGRTSDPNPFRGSENDYRRLGSAAPVRVAGSLAVTRAFGDAYLKDKDLSCAPFQDGCPYITSEPDMNTLKLEDEHQFLILASDGLWDVINPNELPDIFYRFNWEDTTEPGMCNVNSLADRLLRVSLDRAASRQGISLNVMNRIPIGAKRREIHDDISVLAVNLKPRPF